MIYLETERLLLRSWKPEDEAPFAAINQDPRVMEYFPRPLSAEESRQFIFRIQQEFDALGYGLYATETKEEKQFIGYIGLHRAAFEGPFTPCIEIGWRLSSAAWGKGLATEGAAAVLKQAFGAYRLKEIYSFTAIENRRSERVMQKIGMQKTGEFDHPSLPAGDRLSRHVLYRAEPFVTPV